MFTNFITRANSLVPTSGFEPEFHPYQRCVLAIWTMSAFGVPGRTRTCVMQFRKLLPHPLDYGDRIELLKRPATLIRDHFAASNKGAQRLVVRSDSRYLQCRSGFIRRQRSLLYAYKRFLNICTSTKMATPYGFEPKQTLRQSAMLTITSWGQNWGDGRDSNSHVPLSQSGDLSS